MCRSIKQLRQPETPATEAEVRAAALQFVRKVSGYRAPSRNNRAAFENAVDEISAATQRLLAQLQPAVSPKTPQAISAPMPNEASAQ
ncbi:MAG: DUF2277 domain-containing protein [Anaerolineae bacterium]|nr:DUF2277 domain-containing protein [Anaerolineae bacterium]